MNNLIVYAHPHTNSFNHAVLKAVSSAAEENGHVVSVRDLYGIGFKPVLTSEDTAAIREGNTPQDILEEQEFIHQADVLTYVYPIWWTGMPAILKGYIDRVFSFGFAYAIGPKGVEKLLVGKKAVIINTTGTPQPIYDAIGMFDALRKTSDTGVFDFCGIEVVAHKFLTGVPYVTDADRKKMLVEVKELIRGLKV